MFRLGILLIIIVLSSCSVTKRHYRNGFYMSHRQKVNAVDGRDSVLNKFQSAKNIFSKIKSAITDPDSVSDISAIHVISTVTIPEKSAAGSEKKFVWVKTLEKAMPGLFFSEVEMKKEIPTSIEQNEKTQELANEYANTALKSAFWALALSWTVIGGFIFGVRAVNKAKLATMLSDGNYPEIDRKANQAILIAQILFISYTVLLLLAIIITFLRLA